MLDIRGFTAATTNLLNRRVSTFVSRFCGAVQRGFEERIPARLREAGLAEINQFTGDGFLLFLHKDENGTTGIDFDDYEPHVIDFFFHVKSEYNKLKTGDGYEAFRSTGLAAGLLKGEMYYDGFLPAGFPWQDSHPTGVGADVNKAFRLCGIAHGGQVLIEEGGIKYLQDRFTYVRLNQHKLKGMSYITPVWVIKKGNRNADKTCETCMDCTNKPKCDEVYKAGSDHRGKIAFTPTCNTLATEEYKFVCSACQHQGGKCLERKYYYDAPYYIKPADALVPMRIEKECCHKCSMFEACMYVFFLAKNVREDEDARRSCCALCLKFQECHC